MANPALMPKRAGGGARAGTSCAKTAPPAVPANQSIELLPVPAAVVCGDAAGFALVADNAAFRAVGLAAIVTPLSEFDDIRSRIVAFLGSSALRLEFSWQLGTTVNCRYFQVTLARLSADGDATLSFVDQTAERRTEQSLRREMMTDSLSGLPNRAGFGDMLEQKLSEADCDISRLAVLILDIDRFSRVNACLGSLAGDELLITVARRLKGVLRAHDLLARTGGDEFGILLTLDDGHCDADHVARRIQAALAVPFRLSDFEIRVACSIGIAFGSDALADSEDFIRNAQFAVKHSKATGEVEAYQFQVFDIAREQFAMETALRRALDMGKLRLTYQPICDLATGRIIAFEALARWRDDEGVEQSPVNFIPVAEESGLIIPLGRWAMDEAARTLAGWDRRWGANCGIRMAVNLSAIQLQRDHVPRMVKQALAENALTGDRFTLELTESALIADPDRVIQTMHALKALGTTLAMDDFGTGYSNLAYLQKLPIDVLKIDRSFVTGMLADRDKIAIVRAILSLAQALGLKTTAEGIETIELSQTLAAMGCTYGQGFHFARPLEAAAAYALLAARNA